MDLYHAREHLHDLAAPLAPSSAKSTRPGSPPGWPNSTPATSPPSPPRPTAPLDDTTAGDLDKALAYVQTNAHRMRYARFRELGKFVGSGAVEAACKAAIGQRLKLSGMRRSVRGAHAIATLRCQDASRRWDETCTSHNQATVA